MSAIVTNAFSTGFTVVKNILEGHTDWPDPASGLAYRILKQTATPQPPFAGLPLRTTSAAQMRRTPELAAFGYVADRLDDATAKLWIDGFEHLRGRQIYPADRQSFIFNPVEILGVATGLTLCSQSSDAHREWFGATIRKGLVEGQYRTALPKTAAFAALKCLGQLKVTDDPPPLLDLASLASQELMLAAGIDLAFGSVGPPRAEIEQAMLNHLLRNEIAVSDVTEAATLFVALHHIRDKIALSSEASTPTDRILALCRRFPLLVERLQKRQRDRASLDVADEYDVQHLLHGILKLHFDDVRPEEHTPSYGGSSSRVDFFLPRERIVVEAKMTRQNLGQKEVVDQLIIDATRYAQMDGVDTLICLVYDPSRRCINPKTVETDVERAATRLAVRAVICPQGL